MHLLRKPAQAGLKTSLPCAKGGGTTLRLWRKSVEFGRAELALRSNAVRRRDCKKAQGIIKQALTAYSGAPFTQGSLRHKDILR